MLTYIIISTLIVSLVSLVGLIIAGNKIKKFLYYFIAFAAGTLIAAAFFDLIPHALNEIGEKGGHSHDAFGFIVLGIILFFIVEKFIHWHHCGKEHCDKKPVGFLILAGDFVHNFMDGILIAGAFALNVWTGIITSLIVIIHEIPQEFGDFAVLIHSGYSKRRALFLNFMSATSAIIGGVLGYFIFEALERIVPFAVLMAAGGFLYIAMTDIIPEMNGNVKDRKKLFFEGVVFVLTILGMKFFLELLHGVH